MSTLLSKRYTLCGSLRSGLAPVENETRALKLSPFITVW